MARGADNIRLLNRAIKAIDIRQRSHVIAYFGVARNSQGAVASQEISLDRRTFSLRGMQSPPVFLKNCNGEGGDAQLLTPMLLIAPPETPARSRSTPRALG